MRAPQENTQESQKENIQLVQQEHSTGGKAMITDNRPAIAVQRKLISAMESSENVKVPIQRRNNTGLPDNLKSGIENLSGYSMSDVKVHYNSSKPSQLQAHAYAQGTDIHLAPGQEKHLPHEAWHVVQQKQGRVQPTRQLKSKVNINDDAGLEKEADVMGEKARQFQHKQNSFPDVKANDYKGNTESKYNPTQLRASDNWVVQRVIHIGEKNKPEDQEKLDNFDEVWGLIEDSDPLEALSDPEKAQAKKILRRWMNAYAKSFRYWKTSENRLYGNYEELARALAGEVKSAENLVRENALSRLTQASDTVKEGVGGFMIKIRNWHRDKVDEDEKMKAAATGERGRYRTYYGTWQLTYLFGRGITLKKAVNNPPRSLNRRVAIAADYALFARDYADRWNMRMVGLNAARTNHWNPNEGADWTQEAREHNVPLSAGPSATTAQVMALGETIGATKEEKEAMAWGLFSFFNQRLNKNVSGTHRFHEVMAVAKQYGVQYTNWTTPEESL